MIFGKLKTLFFGLTMKKSLIVSLHIGYWLCFALVGIMLLAAFSRGEELEASRLEMVFYVFSCMGFVPSSISFYAFYYFLFPKYLKKKKILQSVTYGILICIVASSIGYLLLLTLYASESCTEDDPLTSLGIILFLSFIAMISGQAALIIKGFITWFEEVKLKDELKQKNLESQLTLVKSQLDPHFLFNTINNIDILILKDATIASDYLNKLSDILRFMLFKTKTEEIFLAQELEYIEKYIELQKIRTANANYVNISIHGKPENRKIAPMVFIPFIENAFKHTNNKKLENAITIHIFIKEHTIQLECSNKFDPTRIITQKDNGLGNELIQKRLQLIYPEKHSLVLEKQKNIYTVKLSITHG